MYFIDPFAKEGPPGGPRGHFRRPWIRRFNCSEELLYAPRHDRGRAGSGLAAAVAVTPSFAGSSIAGPSSPRRRRRRSTSPTRRRRRSTCGKRRPATPLYKSRRAAGACGRDRGGHGPYGPTATTAGYIPTAFTSFGTPGNVSSAVITFSGYGDLRLRLNRRRNSPARSRSWSTGRRPESQLRAGDRDLGQARPRSSTR